MQNEYTLAQMRSYVSDSVLLLSSDKVYDVVKKACSTAADFKQNVFNMAQSYGFKMCCTGGADKSLARPGNKQARKHVTRNARFQQHRDASYHQAPPPHLQGMAPKEIHAILAETLAFILLDRARDLSAPPVIY